MTTYYCFQTPILMTGTRLARQPTPILRYGYRTPSAYSYDVSVENGHGMLSGVVKVNDKKVKDAIIRCYLETSGEFVKEVTSDVNGNFQVTGLKENTNYYLVVIEPTNQWEYRVSSRRTSYTIP